MLLPTGFVGRVGQMGPQVSGEVSPYDADANAFFARITTPPSDSDKTLYNNLITSLKAEGIWSKLDILYVMAAPDSQAARLNLRSSSYTMTPSNAPSFTAYRGYTGDGTTSFLNTGYDTSLGVNLTQNNGSMGVYVSTDTAAAELREMGSRTHNVGVKTLTSNMGFRNAATNTNTTVATVATAVGLTASDRSISTHYDAFRDGVLTENLARGSITLVASTTYICAWNPSLNDDGIGSQYSNRRVSAAFAGGSLSSAQHLALYTALNTFLTSVGAV